MKQNIPIVRHAVSRRQHAQTTICTGRVRYLHNRKISPENRTHTYNTYAQIRLCLHSTLPAPLPKTRQREAKLYTASKNILQNDSTPRVSWPHLDRRRCSRRWTVRTTPALGTPSQAGTSAIECSDPEFVSSARTPYTAHHSTQFGNQKQSDDLKTTAMPTFTPP